MITYVFLCGPLQGNHYLEFGAYYPYSSKGLLAHTHLCT